MSEPQRVGFETTENGDKVRYAPLQKVTKDMDVAAKNGAEMWNEMIVWIRKRGGMEEKG